MKILYSAKEDEWEIYQELLNSKLSDHGFTDFQIFKETDTKIEDIDFAIYAPKNKNEDFSRYKNLKAIFSPSSKLVLEASAVLTFACTDINIPT